MGELKYSLVVSIFLHAAFIYIAATGLPYFSRDLPNIERPVPVDILNIDDVTRVKEVKPEPVEEEETTPEPVRARPETPQETLVPNPDLKPKPKPDQDEVERKKLVASVTPQTKPRAPTSFDAGKIAALIDKSKKDKPTNTREKELEDAVNQSRIAGLEAQRNTATISDFIKRRMEECWSAPVGALNVGDLLVVVSFKLNPEGYLVGPPKVENQTQIMASNNPYHQAVRDSALRAVRLCEPYQLPREMYDQWKDLELKFDPSGMVG